MRYQLLSYIIDEKTQGYGSMVPLNIRNVKKISRGDSCNESVVTIAGHLGTHMDSPRHFNDDGPSVVDYDVDKMIFNSPLIVECKKNKDELIFPVDYEKCKDKLKACDMLFLRTGFFKYRGRKVYTKNNPGIALESAEKIRSEYPNIRCVGIDAISISPFQKRDVGRKTHKEFFRTDKYKSEPLIIVEDMDLSGDLLRLKRVFLVPLMVKGIDGAPCTVVGEFKD